MRILLFGSMINTKWKSGFFLIFSVRNFFFKYSNIALGPPSKHNQDDINSMLSNMRRETKLLNLPCPIHWFRISSFPRALFMIIIMFFFSQGGLPFSRRGHSPDVQIWSISHAWILITFESVGKIAAGSVLTATIYGAIRTFLFAWRRRQATYLLTSS